MLASVAPALPLWAVVPPCLLLMLVLAGYVLALKEADVPESRRRIRTAGCVVMMMTQPIIVYLFAVVTSNSPRKFILTWAMLIGLLCMLVLLALVDVINNMRLHSKLKSQLRIDMANIKADVSKIVADDQRRRTNEQTLRLVDSDESESNSEQE
jgi:hypothetical protein